MQSLLLINQQLMRFPPAVLALLIQVASLLLIGFSAYAFNTITAFNFSILYFIFLQALVSTSICYTMGMAKWWRWIHFSFPLALYFVSMWQVPNEIYLIGFLASLSLFWTTYRSQVPFFPSRPIVWKKVAEILPKQQDLRVIDIGSGLGDLSMYLAKTEASHRIEGIEIAPLPWLISVIRAMFKRSKTVFKLGDYQQLNFADYDVVFAYLSPAAMQALWQKAQLEMHPGSMLISYEFDIPAVEPDLTIAGEGNKPNIYVWKL